MTELTYRDDNLATLEQNLYCYKTGKKDVIKCIKLQVNFTRLDLQAHHLSYKVVGLELHHKYEFKVSASTIVGEGEITQTVAATPVQKGKYIIIN